MAMQRFPWRGAFLLLAAAPAARATALQSSAYPAAQSAQRVERDIRALAGFGTRHSLSDTQSDTRGVGAARRWIESEMRSISEKAYGGRLQVSSVTHTVGKRQRIPDGAEIVDVLGILPGRDAKRLIVVSGHYDSMPSDVMDPRSDAPGADDDASGTSVVLECARSLGGLEPRATIAFMAVAGEEQGLVGSEEQAKAWKEQGYEVEAMFTNDIVGGVRGSNGLLEPQRVRLFSEGVPSAGPKIVGSDCDSPSRQLARYVEEVAKRAVPGFEVDLVFRQDRFLRGGDHKPFNELGWAAVRFCEPNENYDHQHQNVRNENGKTIGDTPEFVDFGFVARVAAVNGASLNALALAPRPPANVMVDTSKLSPSTRLDWDEAAAGTVAGYRVRMRKTTEPRWTKTQDVGLVREAMLENVSKDDWLFAVEAYDAAGHTSLPVYPKPSR
jgi:hypothetical protein